MKVCPSTLHDRHNPPRPCKFSMVLRVNGVVAGPPRCSNCGRLKS